MDSGRRLGPHTVARPDSCRRDRTRRGDEWASGDFRAGGRTHCGRQHRGVAGCGHHRPDSSSAGRQDRPRCPGRADGDSSREAAQGLVYSKVPPPTPAQRRRAAELALADAARWGITSAQDNSDWEDFLVYEELEREGKLTLRISEWLRFNDPVDVLEQHRAHHPANDPMLHTTMLKGFMDGSLGSRTAALLAPYSDDPGNSGLPQYEQADAEQAWQSSGSPRDSSWASTPSATAPRRWRWMPLPKPSSNVREGPCRAGAKSPHDFPLPHRARPGDRTRPVRAVSRSWASLPRCSPVTC